MTQTIVDTASIAVPPPRGAEPVALPRTLSTFRLAVFVIAAVAPLACVIGVLPVALVFGSGTALPLAFVIALTALEIVIAFLQAFVFTILTCLYLNDALHLH